MTSDRRTFLQFAGLAPAAAVAGAASAREAPAMAPDHALTCSAFEACVGQAFAFEKEVFGDVTAVLKSVEAHPGHRTTAEREGRFSILFETTGTGTLEQATYRVRHARFGDFLLFVSPRDPQGRTLEAVFNRL